MIFQGLLKFLAAEETLLIFHVSPRGQRWPKQEGTSLRLVSPLAPAFPPVSLPFLTELSSASKLSVVFEC